MIGAHELRRVGRLPASAPAAMCGSCPQLAFRPDKGPRQITAGECSRRVECADGGKGFIDRHVSVIGIRLDLEAAS